MLFAAGLIISIGLMLIARLIYSPPKDPNSAAVNQITTLATRGDYLNVIFGTRRVGYTFAWAGDRKAHKHKVGKKGFGGDVTSTTWSESGWHLICTGPATKLLQIFASGKPVFTLTLTSESNPSGSTFQTSDGNSFTIYWGEIDQPVNTFLADPKRVGVKSRWPYFCYIIWHDFNLGPSPVWPQIEYVIQVGCPSNSIGDSSSEISDGTDSGINMAHVALQVLNAPFPHGLGIPAEMIDNDSLYDFAITMEDESIPANILLDAGSQGAAALQGILQDAGVTMPQHEGRLMFIAVREIVKTLPILGDDVVSPPDIQRIINRGDDPINRLVFTFKDDTSYGYADQDIPWDDDAEISETGSVASQKITIWAVTGLNPANRIAARRSQEASVNTSIKMTALRGARQLVAGQAFYRSDFGRMRVISKLLSDETSEVTIECSLDTYGIADNGDSLARGGGSSSPFGPEADIDFRFVQIPDAIAITVVRVRANVQIAGAYIFISADGTSYTQVDNQDNPAAGGLLLANWTSVNDVEATGPIFEADNDDAAGILDLTGDDPSWMGGRQVGLIDNEVFFVKSVSLIPEATWAATTAYTTGNFIVPVPATGFRYKCTTSGTSNATQPPAWPTLPGDTVEDGTVVWECHNFSYQMDGLITARYGTVKAAHALGTRVFVFDSQQQTVITDPLIAVGNNLCVKTVPFSSLGVVDIATITPWCAQIVDEESSFTYNETSNGDIMIMQTGDILVFNDNH